MSEDRQDYSLSIQAAAILAYAQANGMLVVQTYEDGGKSGVRAENRSAWLQLMEDIETGRGGFRALLVYDISRFGRFQNPDEAAYYEFRCLRRGVPVHYVAEHFATGSSSINAILKAMKRSMAAEYSRELSVKVRAGQVAVLKAGFAAGMKAQCLGFRRQLVSSSGEVKGLLGIGQRKAIQSDRVRVVLGPAEEVDLVRYIFRLYAEGAAPPEKLAEKLNAEGHSKVLGKPFTRMIIRGILKNELYRGTFVWGKSVRPFGGKASKTSPDSWVRCEGVVPPIVSQELFERAQAIMSARATTVRSNRELLDDLQGELDRPDPIGIGMKVQGGAGWPVYVRRFGSRDNAYAALGVVSERAAQEIQRRQQRLKRPGYLDLVASELVAGGATVTMNYRTQHIDVNGCWRVGVQVLQPLWEYGRFCWQPKGLRAPAHLSAILMIDLDGVNVMQRLVVPWGEREELPNRVDLFSMGTVALWRCDCFSAMGGDLL